MAVDLFFEPDVTLFAPDHRLQRAGFMQRWYPNDPVLREKSSGDLWFWPGINLATLAPKYAETVESSLESWTASTSGTWDNVQGLWETAGDIILQADPLATSLLLEAKFTTNINQAFIIDLYLMTTFDSTWWTDFQFGPKHLIRILYNGVVQLWRNYALEGQEDAWRCVSSCETFESVWGQRLKMFVYVTASQQILIAPMGFSPIVWYDDDPIVEEQEDGSDLSIVTEAYAPRLYVSGGAFYFGWRRMKYATSGTQDLPEMSLPWEDSEEFTIQSWVTYPRQTPAGTTVTTTIQDLQGTEIPSPPTEAFQKFVPHIEIADGDEDLSPEINWVQFYIEPIIVTNTPTPVLITEAGRLQTLRAEAAVDAPRLAELEVHDMDAGAATLVAKRNVCTEISVGGTVLFRGYLDLKEFIEETSAYIACRRKGSDMLKRLEVPLCDAYIGDGMLHTEYVEALFKYCGLSSDDYIIDVDPRSLRLPSSRGTEEPLFQCRDGKSAREMVEYIRQVFSGWDLRTEQQGKIHYALPLTTYTTQATLIGEGELVNIGYWKYFDLQKLEDESELYNYIVVIGEAVNGTPIIAAWRNESSISDQDDDDYTGQEKLLLVVDTTLRTEILVEDALDIVRTWHSQMLPQVEVSAAFAWFDEQEVEGGVITVPHYPDVNEVYEIVGDTGQWKVVSTSLDFEPPTLRAVLEKVPEVV